MVPDPVSALTVAYTTVRSFKPKPNTLSEKVAVTVKAALVGLGALVESATVGTVPS